MCNLLHFPDQTGLHVENETPHWNFLGDPRMGSDFRHLFPGVLVGVFERDEPHRSGREASPVEAVSVALSSSSVNVVNPQPV